MRTRSAIIHHLAFLFVVFGVACERGREGTPQLHYIFSDDQSVRTVSLKGRHLTKRFANIGSGCSVYARRVDGTRPHAFLSRLNNSCSESGSRRRFSEVGASIALTEFHWQD